MANDFRAWVQSVIDRDYGGVAGRLAQAIDISLTTLSRGMELGTLGADTLLRLSLVTGRNPSDLFRLASKPEWAELIEQCYGPPRDVPPLVRDVVALLAALPEAVGEMTRENLQTLRTVGLTRSGSAHAAAAPGAAKIRTRTMRDVPKQ
ncbi:MAG TPA: hypothetical protein VNM92_01660 [Thermoanaerobaculia bacterium]|nr:hypothetical protein [Thermoanaerobaculia bacterium]